MRVLMGRYVAKRKDYVYHLVDETIPISEYGFYSSLCGLRIGGRWIISNKDCTCKICNDLQSAKSKELSK